MYRPVLLNYDCGSDSGSGDEVQELNRKNGQLGHTIGTLRREMRETAARHVKEIAEKNKLIASLQAQNQELRNNPQSQILAGVKKLQSDFGNFKISMNKERKNNIECLKATIEAKNKETRRLDTIIYDQEREIKRLNALFDSDSDDAENPHGDFIEIN